jgi:hypothetical protein
MLARAAESLGQSARGLTDPSSAALSVATAAIRCGEPEAGRFVGLVRRSLVHTDLQGESGVRCLRVLSRVGEAVDIDRLAEHLSGVGRVPRIALTALAEVAATGVERATKEVIGALDGTLQTDAALLLSHLCTDQALAALARHLDDPGPAGLHAATALLALEDEPSAFESLCKRLCDPDTAVSAARALWEVADDGCRLRAAAGTLQRWALRDVEGAERGRRIISVMLTACGAAEDMAATLRALGSEDDELVLLGAQAAYALGSAEQARSALAVLLRRGPVIAGQAFQLMTRWADIGDESAFALFRAIVERRPVDLTRAAMFDAMAAAFRPAIWSPLVRAIESGDRVTAQEAARSVARLREPISVVPPLWL